MPQRETRYLRLGKQITRLVQRLAEEKDWSKTQTMNYISDATHYGTDMIHRWRQGRIRPLPQVIEILAQIGRKETHLPREWGESLLKAAQHPEASEIVNTLW
ncbi:MAG TPA: hypothetical protein VFB12_05740, partial [Ktedonobacteraceae bacterium]|nr:hypothetical protein [Ktedonobacteraceae bacterium]